MVPPVLVLAGGLGTRLLPLTRALPKVLIPVRGRPFVEHVIEELARQGAGRFVLSVGAMAQQVRAQLGDGARLGVRVGYAQEDTPLGTGGAVRRALPLLGERFLVVNGDTLLEVDLAALLRAHSAAGCPLTLCAAWAEDRSRYGALQLRGERVAGFEEKRPGAGPGWINGGVCVMERGFLDGAPDGPFSLERHWLPQRLAQIAAFRARGFFVDMGTHEALAGLEASLGAYLGRRRGGPAPP